MDTIFMKSVKNSKPSKPHVFILNLTDITDLGRGEKKALLYQILVFITQKHQKLIQ